ncbi:efflux RND transporter permease subunit [Elusimicrobiota bacterium]
MIEKVLSRQVTFLMIFIGIMIVGTICFIKIPIELMPNTSFGEISIIFSVRGGIPPDKVEYFVTKPVEEAVGGVGNLKDMITISEEGRATIVLKFVAGADMDIGTMEVREKLSQIKNELPKEVEKPIVAQYEQEDIPVLIVGVTSAIKTPEEIRRIVDDSIKERLARIEGVANVEVYGGRERKILVEIMPDKLKAYNLSMSKVINALNNANVSLLSGELEGEQSNFAIKATGRFENIESIRTLGIAVSKEGTIVRLTDVAAVEDSFLEPENLSRLDANDNVTIYIQKETLASTVKVCSNLLVEVDRIKNHIAEDIIMSVIKNDAVFIENAVNSMKKSLLMGGLLAAGILLFFLRDFKLTLINFFTIPISIFLAVTFLYFKKQTLNVMTLGGLALGVGMLLDNSIVVIENIFRTFQTNKVSFEEEKGVSKESNAAAIDSSRRAAIIEGTQQIALPIIAATLTTIVVFLPIVFLSEDIKQMQSGMALTITYALIASLFVALTMVPLLFLKLNVRPKKGEKEFILNKIYKYVLRKIVALRWVFIIGSSGCFVLAIIFFLTIDMNLFETEEENKFTIHVELPTGAKLEVSDDKVAKVEYLLAEYPEVKQVSSKIEKWSSKIYVTLHPARKRKRSKEEIISLLRPRLKEIQPAFIYFKESQALAAKEVFLDLYGHDYEVLKKMAMNMGGYLKGIEGLEDVKIRMREGRPEKLIWLDRKRVVLSGFTISDIAENLHARLRGLIATRYHEKAKEIETIVRQDRETLADFKDVYSIEMQNSRGSYIMLTQMAEFEESKGPSEIWRKNKKRFVQVSASRNNLSLEKAAVMIKQVLGHAKFPENYFYEIGGDYEQMLKSKKELFMALALTIVFVYLVLGSLFESYIQPLIIMLSVPLALIGVVIALKMTRSTVSTGVIMGIIMLAGIVVNNAIMLVDRINGLKKLDVPEYVVEGSAQRLRPIMMTVITTILGLLPLALKGGEGSGLWRPLSITVIGGLVSSTILVLLIIPCVYKIMEHHA